MSSSRQIQVEAERGYENTTHCFSKSTAHNCSDTHCPASNGGPANIRLGQRDFMLQQNWVNARKGYCAMAAPQQ